MKNPRVAVYSNLYKKKQELIQAAKNRGSVPVNESKRNAGPEEIPFTNEEKQQNKNKRWGKLPTSVRRRSGIDTDADEVTRPSKL